MQPSITPGFGTWSRIVAARRSAGCHVSDSLLPQDSEIPGAQLGAGRPRRSTVREWQLGSVQRLNYALPATEGACGARERQEGCNCLMTVLLTKAQKDASVG